jgi:hypothetical protein
MQTYYAAPKDSLGNRNIGTDRLVNMTGVDIVTLTAGEVYRGPKGDIVIKNGAYQTYCGKEIPTNRIILSILAGQLKKA